MTENELLAVVYAIEKFHPYFSALIVVYTNHFVVNHLLHKKDTKRYLIRWGLLRQEFNIEIKHKAGAENIVAGHLSTLMVESHDLRISNAFPNDYPLVVICGLVPWFADSANYLTYMVFPLDLTYH